MDPFDRSIIDRNLNLTQSKGNPTRNPSQKTLVPIYLYILFQFLSARQKYSEALKYAKEQLKFR